MLKERLSKGATKAVEAFDAQGEDFVVADDLEALVAGRLNVLTRKLLGGIDTTVDGQVLRADGSAFEGLFAAGEVAGFGGGGYHGYNALEGTFLGACIFTGLRAGEAV